MVTFYKTRDQYFGKLFEPKTIAVVGASPDTSKGGNRPLRFLTQHGFCGKIYPVNPKYKKIGNLECYPTIVDILETVDVVMITVPENLVLGVLEDCIKKGVKLAIIRTAFDIGDDSDKQKLISFLESLQEKGLRIMGPNSVGFVNVHEQIPAYFHISLSMERLIPGRIGFISQSGGLSGVIFNKAQDHKIGFSYLFSAGIEADLEAADFIDFLIEDPITQVISCFIEGFKNPKRILTTFEKAAKAGKPVIVMKIGRSELGIKAAKSHTGKMLGKDEIWDAIFRQKGIVRVDTIDELIETSSLFAKRKILEGDRIGILAASGGAATTLVDKVGSHKLNLSELSSHTQDKLGEILPKYASIHNPIDVSPVGDERYLQCLEIFSKDENVDLILLPLTIVPEDFGAKRAREIVQIQKSVRKPIVVIWLGGSLVSKGTGIIEESEIPLFRSEEMCVKALKYLIEYEKFQKGRKEDLKLAIGNEEWDGGKKIVDKLNEKGGDFVSTEILSHFGIPKAREELVNSPKEAMESAHKIGYPVALKVVSPDIIHKTEVNGLRLDIRDDEELVQSYNEMVNVVKTLNPEIEINGILVQEMVKDGAEVILGMYRDPELGPILTFGMGGVFVELLKDIAIRVPPLNYLIAREMIEELKGFEVLKGFRRGKKLDINALIETIVKFSWMCTLLNGKIAEMEINPLVLLEEGKGVKVVDWRIVWKREKRVRQITN